MASAGDSPPDGAAPTLPPAAAAAPAAAPAADGASSSSLEDLVSLLARQIRSTGWVAAQLTDGLPNVFDIAGVSRPGDDDDGGVGGAGGGGGGGSGGAGADESDGTAPGSGS